MAKKDPLNELSRFSQGRDSNGRISYWNYKLNGALPEMTQTPTYDNIDRVLRLWA